MPNSLKNLFDSASNRVLRHELSWEAKTMVLFGFAKLLKWALSAGRLADSVLNVRTADSALHNALRGRLGSEPEALNQLSLIGHCTEAAKSVQNVSEITSAELVSTMLGYFMLHTISPHTFGLIYSIRSHPLLRLPEGNAQFGFTLVDSNRKIIDAKMAPFADLHPDRQRISTAILILKDARDADEFREQNLGPLTASVAANRIDIMAVAPTPEIGTAVASAVSSRGQIHSVDFPLMESGLGLSGISLRCILST
jgi:hypothetical protein